MKMPGIAFGGKCILFSGHFRQILPVLPKAFRGMIVHVCFISSTFFRQTHKLFLTLNMMLEVLKKDPSASSNALSYPGFLLKFGEGSAREGKETLLICILV